MAVLLRHTTNHKLGFYTFGPVIGKGDFGEVYMGRHDRTSKIVAIKTIEKVKMLRCEIDFEDTEKLRVSIRHPNILKQYQVISSTTHLCIVTEYTDTDLERILFCTPEGIPCQEARNFFKQIISGIHFCHKKFLWHGNLELQSFRLDTQKRVKIADFGLSQLMSKEGHRSPSGTPLPPEREDERAFHGPALDVWSCGVILHSLLFGKFPFGTDLKSARQNAMSKLRDPCQLVESLEDLFTRMIDDPTRHATIDDIMTNAWLNTDLPEGGFLSPSDDDSFIINGEIVQNVLQELNKGDDVPNEETEVKMDTVIHALLDEPKENTIVTIYNDFSVKRRIPGSRMGIPKKCVRRVYIKSRDPLELQNLLVPKVAEEAAVKDCETKESEAKAHKESIDNMLMSQYIASKW